MGFMRNVWKPLATVGSAVAAPFTAGTSLAWLGPLLAGGSAIGASLLGRKIAGGRSPGETAALQLQQQQAQSQQEATQRLLGLSTELKPQSDYFMGLAGRSLNPSIDYFSRLLQGSRSDITSLLAPELNRIGEGYTAATNTLTNLTPRAGGTSALMAEVPFRQARDVSALFQTARPMAAEALMRAGGTAGELGGYTQGNILRALGTAAGGGRAGAEALDFFLRERAQKQAAGTSMGKTIFDIIMGFGKGRGSKGLGGKSPARVPGGPGDFEIP